jgi:hypothetical protein
MFYCLVELQKPACRVSAALKIICKNCVQTRKSIEKTNAHIICVLKQDFSEKLSLVFKLKVYCRIYKSAPLVPIQNQMNPAHILAPYYFMNLFNIRTLLPSMFRFPI